MSEKWQVELFLHEFRNSWPPDHFVVPRDKNNSTLAELGLTPLQRMEAVLSLTTSNYIKGPVLDDDNSQTDIWIFGTKIQEVEIYIKLKIFTTGKGIRSGKCISFHKAEFPLNFPLK
ncbi:MAG: toxin [Nitrospiria bacterium]